MTNHLSAASLQGPSRREMLLDAAERLLIAEGFGAATTRRVAEEAGLNHGLIHYYFGSMEELFVRVLERFTSSLIERQREMYAQDVPFLEKWRTAMRYLDEDADSGYQKLWLELQAMAWNNPDLRERIAEVNRAWRQVLTDAFEAASREFGLERSDFPVPALVSLVMTFNQGLILERLSGVTEGHSSLIESIDGWLSSLQGGAR
ncbi:MAG: TetR/AcrR family transcriptional regulator [Actinomycetota bacterium]